MTASAVPAVLDALYTLLDGALTIPVSDGPPDGFNRDGVVVGWSPFDDTGGQSQQDTVTTARGRDEVFDVVVYISTYPGSTYKALRDRALGYAGDISGALHTDPTLSGTVVGWVEVASTAWHQQPVDNGKGLGLELHIRGTARI
jgi:hypothetical protein